MAKPKKPEISTETQSAFDVLHNDRTRLEPELIKYLEDKGYAFRWINLKHFASNGYHKTGYVPFKRQDDTPMTVGESLMGTRPDGFIVRGDSVLAVKPTAMAEAHRKLLADKNRRNALAVKRQGSEMLKSALREGGIKAKVFEGYDENE